MHKLIELIEKGKPFFEKISRASGRAFRSNHLK